MDTQSREPLYGLILIGGRSSRMGRPKHLICFENGETWLERNVKMLSPFVDRVFLSGGGDIPTALEYFERITDAEGFQGPMAGIMGAIEKYPSGNWLVMACDMPVVSGEAVAWLIKQFDGFRGNALIPKNSETGKLEPLFAVYRSEIEKAFRAAAASNKFALTAICEHEDILTPLIPRPLLPSWSNVNNEQQLNKLLG